MRISDWSSDVCSSDLSTSISALAAGTALVIGSDSSGTAGAGLKLRLEHAGYTVTTVADGTGSLVYDQVWDVRISPALSVAEQSNYLDYMQASGSLFLLGEHSGRSEEHTSELQSLMRISYAVFCLKKTKYSHTMSIHYYPN